MMDITKQYLEQQAAKRLQGGISSFIADLKTGSCLIVAR